MAKKLTKTAQIRAYVLANPTVPSAEVAKTFDVKSSYVSTVKWQLKTKPVKNVRAAKKKLIMEYTPPPKLDSFAERVYAITQGMVDAVNHPPHYKDGGIETIDYIEAKGLGYHLGNAVKYISRAGKKGTNQGLEDLKKAQWYLDRAIEKNEYASPNR